tara:strand:- start:2203 stop:2427 length:225 start_codon:yes stop_codon:yes gene_type:complete
MNRLVVRQAHKFAYYGRTGESLAFVQKHFATRTEPGLIIPAMVGRIHQREAENKEARTSAGWHALLSPNFRSTN